MNCKYHKVRTKKGIKYGYCILDKKEVDLFKCHCTNICFKSCNYTTFNKTSLTKPKNAITKPKKNYTITKLERSRFSILTDNLNTCIVCGKPKENLHEVYYGNNRQNSMKYGCVIPLCQEHHTGSNGIHFNKELDNKYKVLMQIKFEEVYDISFIDVFKKNYK